MLQWVLPVETKVVRYRWVDNFVEQVGVVSLDIAENVTILPSIVEESKFEEM